MTGKTYFMDIDGTIVENLSWEDLEKYNDDPYFIQMLLPGVEHFFIRLQKEDIVIFTTARSEKFREMTERTLKFHNIKYKLLIMDLTSGERYLVNDTPNMLYHKSIAINVLRNQGFGDTFIFDPEF
jgi:uncharacterized HAD superfamily protein